MQENLSNGYEEIILVRIGEIALKGANRSKFYNQLIRNIRYRLRDLGRFDIRQSHTRIWIKPKNEIFPAQEILKRVSKIFGIVSASLVRTFVAEPRILREQLLDYANEVISGKDKLSFKIETRRVNKNFPLSSYEVSSAAGSLLLEKFPTVLTVDVHNPDLVFSIEIREKIYLFSDKIDGPKGLPVGMGGKGLALLSGGIDSPVAAWLMASRGMMLDTVYFHTPPYTSSRALDKVIRLSQILSRYLGNHRLYIVNFTDIQLELNDNCRNDMLTIVMRRMMMRIASRLASQLGFKSLITGESLGQVASQTLEALITTEKASEHIVFRPLIGLDKDEITRLSRQIGTYETSIEPYEDCCTVFVSRHPKTFPSVEDAKWAEQDLDINHLITRGLESVTTQEIFLRDHLD